MAEKLRMPDSDQPTMHAFTSALDADFDLITDFERETGDLFEFSVIDGFLADDLLCASGEGEWPSDRLELYFNLPDAGTIDETLPPIQSEIYGGAAQTGVTAMDYPNPTVVHIDIVFPNGAHGHGSGVMVGRNDVLTAGHVLYDPQQGGLAVSAHVIPFYNPAQPNARPYGEAVALQRLGEIIIDPNFPQVGVGIYPTVANNGPGYYGVEIDYGFLTLNRALGDRTSTMSLDTTFTRGVLYQSGYPHHHGDRLTQDAAYASEVTVDNLIDARSFETWTGNSGGPLWRWGGDGKAYVVGIVSTVLRPGLGVQETGRGLAAFDIDPFYASFLQLIRGNDHHIVA